MSKLAVTNFSKRKGSPFQNKGSPEQEIVIHENIIHKSFDKQKDQQSQLLDKVNKKTAEIQSSKINESGGFFTEVVTHGAFTSKSSDNKTKLKPKTNGSHGSKSPLLGFPSSANDLALDAKTDLESDANISKEVKEKVIEKLFTLVSMVQHMYESKVRVMADFEKYKDVNSKNELRREKEHSEQMYKLNMNFQSEVVQAIQQLKSELDISRNVSKSVDNSLEKERDSSIEFYTNGDSDENNAEIPIRDNNMIGDDNVSA